MKAFCAVLVLIAAALLVNAKWVATCAHGEPGCPNVMIDIAAINATTSCIVGGYSSSEIPEHAMGVYCSSKDNVWIRLQHNDIVGMQVAIAGSDKGNIVTAGFGFSNVTSHLVHNIVTPMAMNSSNWYYGSAQDVKIVHTPEVRTRDRTLMASVGSIDLLANLEHLLISADAGRTWFTAKAAPPVSYLRYGAYPRPDTYYITAGTWPTSSNSDAEFQDVQDRCIRLSEHVCTPAPPTLDRSQIQQINSRVYNYKAQRKLGLDGHSYYGAIALTRDGGMTWKTLFQTADFYFNDIACFDINNCIAVAEGNKSAFVMVSNDAGGTWTETFRISSQYMASLMRIRLAGDIAYVSGGNVDDEVQLHGLIYKSTDFGKNWVEDASVQDVGILMGLDFTSDGSHGYALGSTNDQRSIVVKFTRD